MENRSEWTESDRREIESRLATARADGDLEAEVEALVDLAVVCRALGDAWALVSAAQEAWTLAQRESRWDQLARLALLFGEVAYSALDYQQCYDHFANACAYARMAGEDAPVPFDSVVARIDALLDEMLDSGLVVVAEAFCEMLILYEVEGGLGSPDPSFATHFRGRLDGVRAARNRELAMSVSPN